jgi:putative N-acetylmannosamine-6-phosphate epimerase
MNQANAPMIPWLQAWTKNSQTMTESVQRLMRDQFERNTQAMIDIIGAGNVMKMIEVHERWITTTMQSFTEETRRTMTSLQEAFDSGHIHEIASPASPMTRETVGSDRHAQSS